MFFFIWSFLKPTIEIIILWIIFYQTLVFFEGTRSFQVLKGMTLLVFAFVLSQIMGLDTINWLLTKLFGISIIALLIIFQQELRLGLARLGQRHLFNIALEETEVMAIIEEIADAAYRFSKNKTGCIMAIERDSKLKTYIESGINLDARISSELIQSVFNHNSPLHDGGIVIRRDRIIACACLFPLSDNPSFSKIIGTRHRAALGLTEQTDAIVVMVSEESGEVSLASDGRFIPVINRDRFTNILKNLIVGNQKTQK
ncbi:MAG TPA: diadenylate cyclase CdaA [Candidatus Omnitrophota bacterium]|jgi:diadenylate cyclase|nr:diadenylate cyclase CdaA [Candidatus Omnitrophota bacterium]HPN56295.1 diadenylate cyclase CdaA [Candidatus Omnitrophota bacterium]